MVGKAGGPGRKGSMGWLGTRLINTAWKYSRKRVSFVIVTSLSTPAPARILVSQGPLVFGSGTRGELVSGRGPTATLSGDGDS